MEFNYEHLFFEFIKKQIIIRWKTILLFFIVFIVLGIVIAITTPKEWRLKTTMVSESSSSNTTGQLDGLASLAGFSLPNKDSGFLSPQLYDVILNSTSACLELLKNDYFFSRINKTLSLKEYLLYYEEQGLIQSFFKSSEKYTNENNLNKTQNISKISKTDEALVKQVRDRINLNLNEETGLITLDVIMQDPVVVAQMSLFLIAYLNDYVNDFNTRSLSREIKYLTANIQLKKEQYEDIQKRLDEFIESNRSIYSERVNSRLKELQLERDLHYNVYTTLLNKKEEISLKIKKKSNIIHVIDPVRAPYKRTQPRKGMIVIIYALIGTILGLVWVLVTYKNHK